MNVVILKLDLHKAYDSIDWAFLYLFLIKVVLGVRIIDWIMAYVTSTNFVVVINVYPLNFFWAGKGLR